MQYSFLADLLSKFQNSSEFIQTLIVIFGTIFCTVTIIALLICVACCFYFAVQQRKVEDEDSFDLLATTRWLDYIILQLIRKFDKNELGNQAKHLQILSERFKEGAVITEFIEKQQENTHKIQ